jgi:FtsP/CotA-like multicopper oxidase with cupredoxin domain
MRKISLQFILLGVIFTLIALSQPLIGNSNAGNDNGQSENSRSASTPENFVDPPELKSSNGVLEVTLTSRLAKIKIGNQEFTSTVYNGLYVPPTLRVRPGDKIRLKLRNELDNPTNLHYHGLNVSPRGNSDNIFIHLGTDESFNYEVDIPRNASSGLYWYHPHAHGFTEAQVGGGMSGGLIIEGILDPFPQLKGLKERVMLLKDTRIDGNTINVDDDPAKSTRTLNGLINPTIKIRPGETQFWRIGNIGAQAYYNLQLEGHTFYQIARDGNLQNQIQEVKEILLPPASRVEVLIRGGAPRSYKLRSLAFNTGPAGDKNPEVTLATVISEGPAQQPVPLPTTLPAVDDLRRQSIAARREFVFTEAPGKFFINGQQFDMERVDTTVKLGDVEEWTVRNESDEMHTFHIHQTDFQVVEVNGQQVPFVGVQDNVNVPVRGVVKVLIPFTEPVIVGKFVYHCHILSHEDKGMMAVIEVVDPKSRTATSTRRSKRH